ncbi:MAG: hypothetical protein LKF53_01585 [Solobacterium sp.]|jgi:Sec-independent protein translocase protein TatA|nr:hypothetical protein [Solobacterium sp.]MCH4205071.1 hypothetical protein [Solobacterium sp.]MCH4226580.1 hypothetical protein [Solobacterium sp.]MCH4281864.1 hypothetical protein [Solobacterium sp.]
MGISFAPYNFWILYGACAILLICLIILGIKAGKMMKAIRTYQPAFKHIQKNIQLAQIKAEAMQEKKQEDDAKNKKWKILLPFLLAIKHTYDNDASLKGMKGMAKAAKQTAERNNEQRRIFAQFKKNYQ